MPGRDLTVAAKRDGRFVRVLAKLCQIPRIGGTSLVTVRAGKTDDEVDAPARHQIANFLPAAIALLKREDGIAPVGAPHIGHAAKLLSESWLIDMTTGRAQCQPPRRGIAHAAWRESVFGGGWRRGID